MFANVIILGLLPKRSSIEDILDEKHAKNLVWRGSDSELDSRTSRPWIKNSGRTPGRWIVNYSNPKFQGSRWKTGGKIGNRQTDGQTDRRTDGRPNEINRAHFLKCALKILNFHDMYTTFYI